MVMMSLFQDGHHGRHWTNRRQRLNAQVTVAVEPPSPTGLFPVRPEHGDDVQPPHQSRHHRPRHHSRDRNEDEDSTEPRGLQRTRTMPARRTRSPSTSSPQRVSIREPQRTSNSHEFQQCINDNESSPNPVLNLETENGNAGDNWDDVVYREPVEPEVECKVYRVRSFTTKKGGSFVNRGDSIKVCSRRGSRQDVMLLTAPSGESALHRRNSTSGPLGNGNRSRRGSSIGLHHDLDDPGFTTATQRRNSINCVGLQLITSERRTSPIRRRSIAPPGVDYSTIAIDGNFSIQSSGSSRRASLRISPSATGNDVLVVSQTSPSRRSSMIVTASEFFGRTSGHEEHGAAIDDNPLSADDGGGKHNGGHVAEVLRVMVIGSHGVGKTTLTQQLQTSEYLANNSENDQGQCILIYNNSCNKFVFCLFVA